MQRQGLRKAAADQRKCEWRLGKEGWVQSPSLGSGEGARIAAALGFCPVDLCPHLAHPEPSSSRTVGIGDSTPS